MTFLITYQKSSIKEFDLTFRRYYTKNVNNIGLWGLLYAEMCFLKFKRFEKVL
jgi:hypothetical protein